MSTPLKNYQAIPSDTSLEAARIQFSIYRSLGTEGRAKMALELSDNLRRLVETGVRSRHPEYDDKQVHLAVIKLMVGDELFAKAYPGCNIEP
ncbi:MAG: hypothetical protein HYZ34_12000 [Ignavibacteriae bacterium]|nr:hypothetical protein [Ignavibacteriota bacterium]